MTRDGRDLGLENRAQNEDLVLDSRFAQLRAFIDGGDAEHAHARCRGARDLHGAVAVRIGLHGEQNGYVTPHVLLDALEILIEDVEVDFQPGGETLHGSHAIARSKNGSSSDSTRSRRSKISARGTPVYARLA